MTDAIRTPDQILEGLPDFPYEPHYRNVDGLRLAHVDEGDGAPVVMWHGEPTWGFLWRHVLPPVRDAGHRVISPTSSASAARTSRWSATGTPTTATWRWPRRCSRTSTSATRPSSSTTGAARSGCAWRSSTPSAWRAS